MRTLEEMKIIIQELREEKEEDITRKVNRFVESNRYKTFDILDVLIVANDILQTFKFTSAEEWIGLHKSETPYLNAEGKEKIIGFYTEKFSEMKFSHDHFKLLFHHNCFLENTSMKHLLDGTMMEIPLREAIQAFEVLKECFIVKIEMALGEEAKALERYKKVYRFMLQLWIDGKVPLEDHWRFKSRDFEYAGEDEELDDIFSDFMINNVNEKRIQNAIVQAGRDFKFFQGLKRYLPEPETETCKNNLKINLMSTLERELDNYNPSLKSIEEKMIQIESLI